ncbi:MAG: T9SS type A sorting domain-containing protein, partial [Bacteroidota bacterium]
GNIDSQDVGIAYNNANWGANTINPTEGRTQPTNLALTPYFSTVIGSFSASETADHYLIVRSSSGILGASPVRGTLYTVGNTIGNGVVIAYQQGTSFIDTNLNKGTYYYFIFSADTLYCTHNYLTTSPLAASVSLNCGIPIAQPTNLILTRNNTTINGSFTASASADHYLIVRSTYASLTATPARGATYTAGNPFGSGTIVAYQTDTVFADTNVSQNIQYYYSVFAANCTGSPQYLTTSPLLGNTSSYCNGAIALFPSDTAIQLLSANDTIAWYIYNATTPYLTIQVSSLESTFDTVSDIYIYSGNCGNLMLIDTASYTSHNGLYVNTLTVGNNYYIKLTKLNLSPSINFYINNKSVILNCDDTICHDYDSSLYQTPGYYCDLVCNGNFESCAYYPNNAAQIGLACPWGSVNDATPDYFNGGSGTLGFAVPIVIGGYQNDYYHSLKHKAFAGIYYKKHWKGKRDYSEYIYQKLKQPLIKDNKYTVSLKVSLSNGGVNTPTNNIGVYLSNYNPYIGTDSMNNITSTIAYIPAQTWIWKDHDTTYIADTSNNWTSISYNFTPTVDSIQYITIGYFGSFPPNILDAYYYIDEVHVVPNNPPPTITGNFNNCDTITTYTASSPNGTSNFIWNVVNDISYIGDSNIITVHWNSYPDLTYDNPGEVTVTYSDNIGCSSSKTIVVFPCCIGKDKIETINDTILYPHDIVPGTTYNINGVITLDSNITLEHNTFNMGPEAKINVAQGVQFNIDKVSILYAGCEYMWDGVYVNDTSAKVTVTNGSTIQWAINGLVSNNGGVIKLDDANMKENYYNVKISNALAVNYSGSIKNTRFIGATSLGWPPYQGIKTLVGVYCDSIHYITIGDYSSPSYQNTFSYMQYGIYAFNSVINVFNNQFKHIEHIGSNPPPFQILPPYIEGSIYAMYAAPLSQQSTPLPHCGLIVGGDDKKQNVFDSCNTGIFSYHYINLLEHNNFINGKYGISLVNTLDNSIVRQNSISESNLGVLNPFTAISIQNLNSNSNPIHLSVDSNWIQNQYTGIFLRNITSNFSKSVKVQNNTITNYSSQQYPYNLPLKYYGIEIHNCDNLLAKNNSISRYPIPDLTINQNSSIRGIWTDYSKGATIQGNNMTQMGSGIYTSGTLTSTQFECNNLKDNYYGIQFGTNSKISNQGVQYQSPTVPGLNPDNIWYDSYFPSGTACRLYSINGGLISNFTYFHQPSNSVYDPDPYCNYSLYIISPFQNADTPDSCSNSVGSFNPYVIIKNAAMREIAIGGIVRNQFNYDTIPNGYTIIATEREYVYKQLASDSSLINMGDTSDYVYQAFYNTMLSSDAAHYFNALAAIDTNDLVTAQNELNLITDTNDVNHNRILVGSIYLNTWALGNYELTKDQSGTLYNIAYSDPYTNGDAVYLACVMLNINPDDINYKEKSLQQYTKPDAKPNTVHVYPNPAKESITIAFDQPILNDGIIEIWSIMGNKLILNTIAQSSVKQIINVSSLTSGIYFYVIKINGVQFSSGKLIILNK